MWVEPTEVAAASSLRMPVAPIRVLVALSRAVLESGGGPGIPALLLALGDPRVHPSVRVAASCPCAACSVLKRLSAPCLLTVFIVPRG